LAAGFGLLVLSGTFWAGGPPGGDKALKGDKHLEETLVKIINRGADLYNNRRDAAGCAGVYEGGLLALKGHLKKHPGLQKEVEDALKQAETTTDPGGRAFALNKVLHNILKEVRGETTPTKDTGKDKGTKDTGKDKGTKDTGKDTGKDKGTKDTGKDTGKDKGTKDTGKDTGKDKGTKDAGKDKGTKDAGKDTGKDKGTKDTGKDKGTKENGKQTLWERLGGEKTVTMVIKDFMHTSLADPALDFTRGGTYKPNEKEVLKELVEFTSQHTGGPLKYNGPDMKEVHKDMHITNKQFDLSVEHLKKALEKNGAPAAASKELLDLVQTTRKDIVDPKAKDTDKKQTNGKDGKGTSRLDQIPAADRVSRLERPALRWSPRPEAIVRMSA
jgi:truncated hemoglobin YjbI